MSSKKQFAKFIKNNLHNDYLYACETGNIKFLKRCINKVDINYADDESNTGVMIAAYHNKLNVIQFFINRGLLNKDPIKYGVNIYHENIYGYNALDLALLKKRTYHKFYLDAINLLRSYFKNGTIKEMIIDNINNSHVLLTNLTMIMSSKWYKFLYYIFKYNLPGACEIMIMFAISKDCQSITFNEQLFENDSFEIMYKIYEILCNMIYSVPYLNYMINKSNIPKKYTSL